MRFRVHVADRESGNESSIELDCISAEDAANRAAAAGYLVARVHSLPSKSDIDDSKLLKSTHVSTQKIAADGSHEHPASSSQMMATEPTSYRERYYRFRIPLLVVLASLILITVVLVMRSVAHQAVLSPSTQAGETAALDDIEQNIQQAKNKTLPKDRRCLAFAMLVISEDPRVQPACAEPMADQSFPMRASAARRYWTMAESSREPLNRPHLAILMEKCASVWGSVVVDETQKTSERTSAASGIRNAMERAVFEWAIASSGPDVKADAKEALRIGLVKGVFPVRQLIADQSEIWMKNKWSTPRDVDEFHVECLDLIAYVITEMKDDPELLPMAKTLLK